MAAKEGIEWTNRSVLRLAGNHDPVAVIERKARELVLQARDAGWKGPPFNPLAIADLLNIPVEANVEVSDAITVFEGGGLKIQFNPTQPRERVRFSIAHEIAHTLFPDVAEEPRRRGGNPDVSNDWQLEMLCNLAASEFVMPLGSLPPRDQLPAIEELMKERRRFDVSAEAFLIRMIKSTEQPLIMFCAAPVDGGKGENRYRIGYAFGSKSAPAIRLTGKNIPNGSVVYSCTAIGYTDRQAEEWITGESLLVECVGIPGYPGSRLPRVAGIIRLEEGDAQRDRVKVVHGNVLEARGSGDKIICQMVNDQARSWGGGLARATAKKFPSAQADFSKWILSLPRRERLGSVHLADVGDHTAVATIIGQEGIGPSTSPRVRYAALERAFETIAEVACRRSASVHMPRIGTGESGGSWDTVEEIVRSTLTPRGVQVTIYDLPPKRASGMAELFG